MAYMLAVLLGGGAVFVAVGGCDRLAATVRVRQLGPRSRPRRLLVPLGVLPDAEPGSALHRRGGGASDSTRGQLSAVVAGRSAYGWPRIRQPPSAGLLALRRKRALQHLPARRRNERQNRSAVLGLCAALVAELRAGRQPGEALDRAGLAWPSAAPRALSAVRVGDDVVEALMLDAEEPGRGGLRALAVCWQVAAQQGAGLGSA